MSTEKVDYAALEAVYANATRIKALKDAAYRIRAELVCCDIYAKVNDRKEMTFPEAVSSKEWHDLCYWGEASARIAERSCLAQGAVVEMDCSGPEQRISDRLADDPQAGMKWVPAEDGSALPYRSARSEAAIIRGSKLLGLTATGRHRRA